MSQESPNKEISPQDYSEQDLLRDAESNRAEKITQLTGTLLRDEREKLERLEGDTLILNFLNNFHAHLPGGYLRGRGAEREKKLQQDVDEALERLGSDPEVIIQWRENPGSYENQEEAVSIVKTLFIEMRRLGYSSSVLTK